jgi:hypothetical protein
MSGHDIVDRLRAAVDCAGELTREEIEGLFIEAIDAIEFLRSLLEPLDDVGLEDLPPKGSA